MTDLQLYTELSALPPSLKEEVKDFIAFLKAKAQRQNVPLRRRQFGAAKGFFKMSEDFDGPLEVFKEYSQ